MRNLIYKLADGNIVKTYKEALNSGQSFKPIMEDVPPEEPVLSPKRKAMRVVIPH